MFDFDITKMVPKFLREDRNGYALMKAIEAGMTYFLEAVQAGLEILNDPEKMPEWRLDELAWEYGIVYDNDADVNVKRNWITNAVDFYKSYGTAGGIEKYLKARFADAIVQEWWEYDGDPYHFKVSITGDWNQSINAWAVRAVNEIKNVRSVLDEIAVNGEDSESTVLTGSAISGIEIAMSHRTSN